MKTMLKALREWEPFFEFPFQTLTSQAKEEVEMETGNP